MDTQKLLDKINRMPKCFMGIQNPKKAINDVISYLNEQVNRNDEITVTWYVEDVIQQFPENSGLTHQDGLNILAQIKHSHEANIGIKWDVIDPYIDMLLVKKQSEKTNHANK